MTVSSDLAASSHLGGRPRLSRGSVLFMLALIGAVAVFWDGLVSLGSAWATPEYSHGPLIPLVSFYLFLREMRMMPPAAHPIVDRGRGLILTILALLIGLAGVVVQIPDIITYGLILWIFGLILICFGWRRGLFFWPSVLHLVYMLPLPQFIYWPLTIQLQFLSSEIGVWVIYSLGIPVYLDGNVIDLGAYKLLVAEACSGLRYLFPILSFSYIFAILYRGPVWHKIVLLLAAAPITVLMNAFRIGMIGVLVDSHGIAQAEGFLHTFEGWVIFVACIGMLTLLAVALQRTTRNPRPIGEALDLDFNGLHRQIARLSDVVPSRHLVLGALLALVLGAGMHLAPERSVVPVTREPLVVFPRDMAGWQGQSSRLDPEIESVLDADDYYVARYVHIGESAPVDLFVAWYARQTGGSGIHSPEVCLPAGGWEVSSWDPTTLSLAGTPDIRLNRAVIRKGLDRQLVYYWFDGRGRRLSSDYLAKAYTVRDAALDGRTDGGLVRLVTPLSVGEDEAEADARLRRFMVTLLPLLPRFVPD